MVANKLLTLAFVREPTRLLLGMKKRGFGEGRWNGFGGKVQAGESIHQGAIREMKEECNVDVQKFDQIGIMMFEFLGDPQLLEVHVFQTREFSGEVKESDEMRPQWYNYEDVPFKQMWPDDEMWFPYMLRDEKFYAYFTFEGMSNIVDTTLYGVKDLSSISIPKEPQYEKLKQSKLENGTCVNK